MNIRPAQDDNTLPGILAELNAIKTELGEYFGDDPQAWEEFQNKNFPDVEDFQNPRTFMQMVHSLRAAFTAFKERDEADLAAGDPPEQDDAA